MMTTTMMDHSKHAPYKVMLRYSM